ncbi:MAG: protoporphyrinogen oxidase [Acidimicrobiia bacterium]|nr:protoporphyrinogen oxidase [Acidimicrobiia bacterium]
MEPLVDTVVIGAGIAGLSAAWELQRRGLTVSVLERTPRAGGVILSERFDGWVIDGGPDSLLVQKPAGVALCHELGLGDRLHPTLTPRTAYVLRGGRLHPIVEGSFLGFPLSARALATSSLFTWPGKLRMGLEVLVPRRTDNEDEALGAFVARRFGREAAEYLADPLLAGIHAGDADRLSARALFPRLVAAESRHGSVLRAFRTVRGPASPDGAFVSLPGGIGELTDRLEAALMPGTLRLSTPVTRLHHDGAFVVSTDAESIRAKAVIAAVPAYAAAALLGELSPDASRLCAEVPYASTATVALGYRRSQVSHPLSGTGFVVPRRERCPILAGTWVSSKWPGRAPDGCVLLRAFVGGGRDPEGFARPDEELVSVAHDALARVLHISGPPLFSRLYRWERRSPQFEVGHLDRMAAIERHLAAVPGLFVAGSGFRSIGIPDCVADAREAAARAAAHTAASVPARS